VRINASVVTMGFERPTIRQIAHATISREGAGAFGCVLGTIGLVFLVSGVVAVILWSIVPIVQWAGAKTWEEVPCEILASDVEQMAGQGRFRVRFAYRYSYQGASYTAQRRSFLDVFVPVDTSLRPGDHTVCYVNPEDPSEAVLNSSFSFRYLAGLWGVVVIALGLGFLAWGFGEERPKPQHPRNETEPSAR